MTILLSASAQAWPGMALGSGGGGSTTSSGAYLGSSGTTTTDTSTSSTTSSGAYLGSSGTTTTDTSTSSTTSSGAYLGSSGSASNDSGTSSSSGKGGNGANNSDDDDGAVADSGSGSTQTSSSGSCSPTRDCSEYSSSKPPSDAPTSLPAGFSTMGTPTGDDTNQGTIQVAENKNQTLMLLYLALSLNGAAAEEAKILPATSLPVEDHIEYIEKLEPVEYEEFIILPPWG